MKRLKEIYQKILNMTADVTEDHVGAYAAQSAYFFMLCMIPIILLLITMVQYTPVTKADVMTAVIQVFPTSVDSMITAGKGVLAMTSGLNCVYKCNETRNYIFLRIRATIYTVMFILVIIFLLVLSVFGNTLNIFIAAHVPILKNLADRLIAMRTIITPIVLMIFCLLIYKFLPNRKDKLRKQLPGAVFAAIGWMIVSWIFSVYVDIFKGFSDMYGSLTTIVLIMLWMYFCMYCILLGGELNMMMYDKMFTGKGREKL